MEDKILSVLYEQHKELKEKLGKVEASIIMFGGVVPDSLTDTLIKLIPKTGDPAFDRANEIFQNLPSYPKNGTWKDKVLHILKIENKPLRSSEISEKIFSNEPNPITMDVVEKAVAQTLWSLKNSELIDHEGKFYSIKK